MIAVCLICALASVACSGSGAAPGPASTAPPTAQASSTQPPTQLPITATTVPASTRPTLPPVAVTATTAPTATSVTNAIANPATSPADASSAVAAPVPAGATPDRPFGARTRDSGCTTHDGRPDSACTPGAIFPDVTATQVCQRGYSASVRNVPAVVSHEVYREYGIVERTTGQFEVDHYVALEDGGSNDIANLWPEAADPKPGFHEKDQVENYLHDQVCTGRMNLFDAQRAIATDWLQVYQRLRQPGLPVVAPTIASVLPPQPAPASGGVQITSVSGAAPGGNASLTARTTAGASCSITYQTPAGTSSTAQGLTPRTADGSGDVAWTWSIGPSTRAGTGSVVVTCDGASDSTPIPIG
jgi:hypothetical protein